MKRKEDMGRPSGTLPSMLAMIFLVGSKSGVGGPDSKKCRWAGICGVHGESQRHGIKLGKRTDSGRRRARGTLGRSQWGKEKRAHVSYLVR